MSDGGGGGGPFYGDLRVTSDRRKGACFFWVRCCSFFSQLLRNIELLRSQFSCSQQVVPDVAPGFNTPAFYEDFVEERRAHVQRKVMRREDVMHQHQQKQQQQPQPPPQQS